jgi:hypothetical protein
MSDFGGGTSWHRQIHTDDGDWPGWPPGTVREGVDHTAHAGHPDREKSQEKRA